MHERNIYYIDWWLKCMNLPCWAMIHPLMGSSLSARRDWDWLLTETETDWKTDCIFLSCLTLRHTCTYKLRTLRELWKGKVRPAHLCSALTIWDPNLFFISFSAFKFLTMIWNLVNNLCGIMDNFICTCRKIQKISPRLIFFKGLFWGA